MKWNSNELLLFFFYIEVLAFIMVRANICNPGKCVREVLVIKVSDHVFGKEPYHWIRLLSLLNNILTMYELSDFM